MTTTVKQLETMSVYVPPSVARLAFQNPHKQLGGTWRRFYAATVFADISGFTPLAEALASSGVRGAEELTTILNQVFKALITAAELYGGHVVKFGGDALSLIWPCGPKTMDKAIWHALQASFAMQAAMAQFSTVPAGKELVELRMKIGISAGELLEVHAGGVYKRWEYVLAGEPMANMSSAENKAEAGQIVVDEKAWNTIGGRDINDTLAPLNALDSYSFGEEIAPGFYRVTHLWSKIPPQSLTSPDWSQLDVQARNKVGATLRSYIPGAISNISEHEHKGMLAELKPMTVCFVGFSGLDYNAPDAGECLSNFMSDAQTMIYHYEGSVNKLAVGDKGSVLLVLFGAPPFFHEDDEARGVACALSLGKVAERYNLELRVGLTAGPLFAGPLGASQRREYTVIGDMVNLAARLMQKAEAGEVWVDQSVQSKTERFFAYKDLGLIQVKGKSNPRRVHLALHEKEQEREDDDMMGYLLSNQELTGRDEELIQIEQLTEKVWDGKGQILLLSGEAGVGKSRLAVEIARRWMTRGGVSHRGDCVSYGGQTPYLPWRGVIASMVGLSSRLSHEERAARLEHTLAHLPKRPTNETGKMIMADDDLLKDYWSERLPLLAGILGLDVPETELTRNLSEDLRRDNLFATIRAIILQEARQNPILVLLEDTHWSDELSMELAGYLAVEVCNYPIFLILVHRPLGKPKPMTYQKLQELPYSSKILIDELSAEASLKLVQRKLGVKILPHDLAKLIRQKGQGNPFFIEELVNSLLSMGVLKIENGECEIIGDLNKLELPDTVQKVILARLDRLKESEKVTLKVAAAIGRTFQRDLLEAVHPWFSSGTNPKFSLNDQLKRLQAEDFTRQEIRESDNLDFLFKHVITQEVAYETLLYSQRHQLHATIATVLEERYLKNDGESINLLAYHYARSNKQDKALYYLHRAGQKNLADYANEAAISYFSEAMMVAQELQQADKVPPEVDIVKIQYDILADRERAYNRLGNRDAQAKELAQMKKLALEQGDISAQLETLNRQLLLATNLGHYTKAFALAEESLALASKHPVWRARTLTHLGITCWRQGRYDKAGEAMQQALQLLILEGAIDDQLKATCLNYLGLINTRMSNYEQAREGYIQALNLYQTIGDRGGEAGTANNLGLLEASLGRYKQARQYYNQALSICHTTGDRLREGISLNTLGQVETILGHYHRATDLLKSSLEIRQAINDRRGEAFCLHDLGYLYLAQGEPIEAAQQFQVACEIRQNLGEIGNYISSLAALGEARLMAHQFSQAEQLLQQAIEELQKDVGSGEYPPQNIWWIYARVCLALDKQAQAQKALQKAYNLMQDKATQIQNKVLKQSYLNNVQMNAAIMAEIKKQDKLINS